MSFGQQMAARETPKLVLLHDLRLAWRAACAALEDAWSAWCAGHGNYERVIAALDREAAAARALAGLLQRPAARP